MQVNNKTSLDSVINFIKHVDPLGNTKYVVKSPGRVNIIGEHIDYCGYSVLPITLSQSIFIAVELTNSTFKPGTIELLNTCADFNPHLIDLEEIPYFGQKGPPSIPLWYHYVICGIRAIFDHFGINEILQNLPKATTFLIGDAGPGTGIPHSAGLSSSSALVVGSALAFLRLIDRDIEPITFANLCASAEKYIGTQGGGMDQAACILDFANQSGLKHITLKIPPGVAFVVADSKKRMNKAATQEFNIRVAECRLICALLLANKGLKTENFKPRIHDVQRLLGFETSEEFLSSDIVQSSLPEDVCDKTWINKRLSIIYGLEDPVKEYLPDNLKNLTDVTFKLKNRLKHVLLEASRVNRFKKLTAEASNVDSKSAKITCILQEMGQLMNESHYSCQNLYECSCSELDKLTECCREAGALGSRLTGAGWGGCTISMVMENNLETFISEVNSKFYGIINGAQNLEVFASKPSQGATVFV